MSTRRLAVAPLVCLAALALLPGAAWPAPSSMLHLVCSGVETTDIIYGSELDPPRKGDFRVEYLIDLGKKGIVNARNGKLTPISIDAREFSFGTATDFNPGSSEVPGPKTHGTGAGATGVVINRAHGTYFSISTRKYYSTDPLPEGATEPPMITQVRTRQGVCTDAKQSSSF